MDDKAQPIVQTVWSEKELIKSIPGSRWNSPIKGMWNLPLGWGSYCALYGVFGSGIRYGERFRKWAIEYRQNQIVPALELRTATEPQTINEHDSRLYPFQRAGVDFLTLTQRTLLGDDMGSGKTVQVLAALRQQPKSLPALIICPNAVKLHWQRESEIWYPESTPYVVSGSVAAKRKILMQAACDPTAIIIVNIEAVRLHSRLAGYGSIRLKKCRDCDPVSGDSDLKISLCEVHPKELNTLPFTSVIIDEAHRIKDPHSKQTRAVWAVAHQPTVERVWAMTGTPIANSPLDLWSIMHAVAPNDYATRSKFIDRYCLTGWNAFGALNVIGIQPERRKEFFAILDPHFRAMPKSLVLPQLPPITTVVRNVDMVPKQARAYNEINTMQQTELGDELLSTPWQITKRIRLMQLASSYCEIEKSEIIDPENPGKDWIVRPCEPSPKIDELLVCLEELGPKPVVIAAEHRQLIELTAARFDKEKISYGLITGAVSQFDRDRNLRKFQNSELRALLITVKAGGTGLTMTAADTIIFIQRPDSMIDYVQTMNRVHRIGSERHKSILVVHITTNDTIEDRQMEKLNEKIKRLEEIKRSRDTVRKAGGDLSLLDTKEQLIMNSKVED